MVAVRICPPLAEYSREAQRRAFEELDRLPDDSELRRLLRDHHELRVRIRAACF